MKKPKNKPKKKYNEKQIEKIKSDAIRLAILYRSLYILKQKFEKHKNGINKLYDKYYGGEKKKLESYDHRVIKTSNFFSLVFEIFGEMKITIPKINDPKEIFNYDVANFNPNDKSHTESIKLLEKIVLDRKNIDKYNKIYYLRKIKPLVDSFLKNKDNDDVTECYKITEYDRKGRVVHTCDELLEAMGLKNGYTGLRINPKDEYDRYMKKGEILFVDTLPIIIADFLQANQEYVVINLDLNDKTLLDEIKRLFDEDILKKIKEKEEVKLTVKEPEIIETEDEKKLRELYEKKKKLEQTLKLYQELLSKKKQNGESYKYILDFIDKLKIQIAKLNDEIKDLINKINGINPEEKIDENAILPPIKGKINEIDLRMREIFSFYCSQHRAPASYPTFAQISYKVNHMNVSEFCKFCKDFKIPLDIDKLMEIYNKREPINENSEINYNEFLMILYRISIFLNETKKRKLQKKIDKIKKKMEGQKVSSDSEENENEEEEIIDDNEKLEKKQNELDYLNKLNFKAKFAELQKYLEIDKPKKYRDKMKGFLIKYHDDLEKIERYEPLTKEEILKVQEKVEQFKKIREENEKEKENIKKKKKKELYEIKKEGFIEQNKRLLRRLKEKEEKKTYIMLKKYAKEDKKFIININQPTEELKINLNKDDKKLLYIDEEEENSDEDILEKYGVQKNKKLNKKEDKKTKINDLNEETNKDNKEIKNELNATDNSISKVFENNENNYNFDNINLNTNENLSNINTSNTNATNDIKFLKQNLKPKKRENIYFFSNKANEIKEEDFRQDEKMVEKIEEKKDNEKEEEKDNEKNNKKDNNIIIDLKSNKKEEKIINLRDKINNFDSKSENINKNESFKEGIYLTEPDINKFRKRTIPINNNFSPREPLNRKLQIKNRIGSNSLEMRKKINMDLLSNKKNSQKEKNEIIDLKNNSLSKSIDIRNQKNSYDKISVKSNPNSKHREGINYQSMEKKIKNKFLNSIKKNRRENKDNNLAVIQLPSVNISSKQNNKQNLKENKINNENDVIVLPGINHQKSSLDNINNKEISSDNKRYLLFQKNNNKESNVNKSVKFNNNIQLFKDKEKNKKEFKGKK